MKRDDDQVLQRRSVDVGVASENAAVVVVVNAVVNAVVKHEVGKVEHPGRNSQSSYEA